MDRYSLCEGNVKILGRTAYVDGVRWCGLSGSGVEFVVRAKNLSVGIISDNNFDDETNRSRIGIFIDGERIIDEMISVREKIINIFEGNLECVHVVRIVKLSECAMSTFGIKDILSDGEVMPTAKKQFLVEFVGDSITCGYGVDDEDENHQFKTSTEDCTKAFAYRTAKELDVDYSLVSFSGYGVVSGYTDSGIINDKELLPPHYEKTGFSYGLSGEGDNCFKIADIPWEFSARQPDVVFVNLGTNDASYCGEDPEKQEVYIEKYLELLKIIRKNNPDSFILCGLGVMGDVLYPSMCEAVRRFSSRVDGHIDTVYFEAIKPETEGYASNYHPTARTHERVSEILAEKMKAVFKKELCVNVGEKVIALTFDDGPSDPTTSQILDILEKEHAAASFFLEGKNITDSTSAIVKRAAGLGCDIENHSFTHAAMTSLSSDEMIDEINRTSEKIFELTGKKPEFFRPPYIAVNEEVSKNVPIIMIAGYGAEDWEESVSSSMRVQRILAQIKDGCIILLHDAEGNTKTVDALENIICLAKKLGYRFVTISGLFKEKDVSPVLGVVYNEAV